jgi:hypothetical protein
MGQEHKVKLKTDPLQVVNFLLMIVIAILLLFFQCVLVIEVIDQHVSRGIELVVRVVNCWGQGRDWWSGAGQTECAGGECKVPIRHVSLFSIRHCCGKRLLTL